MNEAAISTAAPAALDPQGIKGMRVAVVTTQWGPPWNEGVRNIARCLVASLDRAGADVSVIAPPPRGPVTTVFPVWRSLAFALEGAARARRLRPDVLVLLASVSSVVGLRSWLFRRLTGRPIVLYLTGLRRLRAGCRVLLSADRVLVNSPVLQRLFPGAPIVPPVTPRERWRPRPIGRPPGRPVILFLGAFERCRGVEYLIESMAHVPAELRARLRLAWNGVGHRRYDRIREAAQAAPAADRIEFVASADVADLYAEASVVVIPRIAPERMTFPLRIVEAVHAGVPLVVTRINDMDRLVEGCGLAVPPRDARALGDAVTRVLTDDALYERLAAGCRARAREWDAERSLETFHEAVRQCR